jgi:hypothetical protein
MKSLFICFITFFITVNLNAQTFNCLQYEWADQCFSAKDDRVKSVVLGNDEHIYAGGYYDDSLKIGSILLKDDSASGSSLFLSKTEPNGNVTWAVTTQGKASTSIYLESIAKDSKGDLIVCGRFFGVVQLGNFTLSSAPSYADAIFIAKINAEGQWQWARKAGNAATFSSSDWAYAIKTDVRDNIYVTGYFTDNGTYGTIQLNGQVGSKNIFVSKLDASGNFLWANSAICNNEAISFDLTVDNNSNVMLCGRYLDTIKFGQTQLIAKGNKDIFVAKTDSSGNWIWATSAGGTAWDAANGITCDENGDGYITGFIQGNSMFGNLAVSQSGGDIIIAKISNAGNWVWVKNTGGAVADVGEKIVYKNGSLYTTGRYQNSTTFGSTILTSKGIYDIYAGKLDTTGNWFWVKSAGGIGWDQGVAIDVDANNNAYIGGFFENKCTFDSIHFSAMGASDGFVFKLAENSLSLNDIKDSIIRLGDSIVVSITGNNIFGLQWNNTAFISDTLSFSPTLMPSKTTQFILTAINDCGKSISDSFTITVLSDTTSINITNNFQEDLYSIYPNPFMSEIIIQSHTSDLSNVSVFDLTGKCVYEQKYSLSNSQNQIDLANLANGLYSIMLTQMNGKKSFSRIVKIEQ